MLSAMRAVICSEIGPPDGLRVAERDDLEAGPGRVVVDVQAAGVNYVDALFVEGKYQIKPPVPFIPGSEIAGVIRSVGDGVEGFAAGNRVLAMPGLGGYAEQVDLSPFQLVPVPDGMTMGQAASFTQSYATALFALRDRAGASAGETVLVLGAGGGVGLATIDVARALGLRAIAAASTEEKRAAATAMGASAVIDTTTEDLKVRARELAGGDGVDLVLDPIGGDLAEPALRSLGYRGRYIVIGFAAGSIPRLPLNQVLLKNRSIVGVDWGAWQMGHATENRALLDDLLALVAAGTLHPDEPTTYPFERAADALNDLLNRRVTGKVVLVP
jgi:NADPH2:quinone reductase